MLILQMLETVMLSGQEWKVSNKSIDHYIESQAHIIPEESDIQEQILRTSEAFATDMLVVKFIQGLPIVGIIGGMGNPIYYKKIMENCQTFL